MKVFKQIFIIVILPLLFIGVINYSIDPDYTLRKTHIPYLVEELVKGNCVSGPVNINSRELKRQWIEKLPYLPNMLVLGSSRTLALSHKSFPNKTFFNASVTNCTFQDMYSFIYLFDKKWGKLPENIIICVDQWLLGNSFADKQWLVNRSYFVRMAKKTQCYDKIGKVPSEWELNKERIKELFSVKYLVRSIILRERVEKFEIADTSQKNIKNTFISDGSRKLPGNVVNAVDSDINKLAVEYYYSSNDERFNSLDANQCSLFECLIEYLTEKGCNIILFIPPYHPATYQLLLESDKTKGVFASETYLRQNFKNLTIVGATNPDELNLSSFDFYDGVHLKPLVMNNFFAKNLH